MKTRTSVVLAVIAAGLGIFIYFFERHQPSTDELRNRGDRVMPGFDRDRVDRIVLGEGEGRVELERDQPEQSDASPPGAVGEWRLTHPRELDADPGAVDKLLSAIDWLERRRTVDLEKTGKTLAQLGLAEPRKMVSLRLRGRDVTLKVGGEAPGKGLYLSLSTDDDVYVVEEEFLDQISKGVGDLRDKRLGKIRVPEVEAIRITGLFHALREGEDRWRLQSPIKMRANARGVEDVVRDLERLRAERFIADDVTEEQLSRYGLDRPAREVTLRVAGEQTITLRFGETCEGHGGEVYVTAVASGTVACVSQDIVEELNVDPLALRDLRATTLEAEDLDRIVVTRGARQLTLRRQGGSWRLHEGDVGGEDGDEGDRGVDADEESVADFVEGLRGARAEEVVESLAGTGLEGDDPRADAVVRLVRSDDGGEEVLAFAVEPERVLLRRDGEEVALILPADLESRLLADTLMFRNRDLIDEDEDDAREIELTTTAPPMRQVLKLSGTSWGLTTPFEFRADEVLVRDIVDSVSKLRADRFVAAVPTAEHGLSRPRIRLRIQYSGAREGSSPDGGTDVLDGGGDQAPREFTVLIGAEADEGWYARLDGSDRTVFTLPSALVEKLDGPLVDRDLFAVEEDRVESLVIERAGQERVEVERHDGGWRIGGDPAPGDAVDAILARLAVVRASEVFGFGAPGAAMGLRNPRARLFVRISEEDEERTEERVIMIGSAYGDDDAQRVYVRREGVDATFGVPERAIRPILEFGMNSAGGDGGSDSGDAGVSPSGSEDAAEE